MYFDTKYKRQDNINTCVCLPKFISGRDPTFSCQLRLRNKCQAGTHTLLSFIPVSPSTFFWSLWETLTSLEWAPLELPTENVSNSRLTAFTLAVS